MTPHQLAVLADHLRSILPEQDAADVARWAANAEAVRELLSHIPRSPAGYDLNLCNRCAAELDGPHLAKCQVAAAWRALGDPRGAADIERAWEEAKEHDRVRGRPIDREALRRHYEQIPHVPSGGWVGHALHAADADEMVAVRLSPGAAFARGPGRGMAPGYVSPLPHAFQLDDYGDAIASDHPTRHMYAPDIDTSEALAASPLVTDEILLRHVAEARRISDARGMEAVEDEARLIHRMAREMPFNTQGEPMPFVRR